MTDWMPFGFVLATGTLVTLWLILRALHHHAGGGALDLKPARAAFGITAVATVIVYAFYLVAGEGWLWY